MVSPEFEESNGFRQYFCIYEGARAQVISTLAGSIRGGHKHPAHAVCA
jgi:hypothetical protein